MDFNDFLKLDWSYLLSELMLPGCILAAAVFAGVSINSFVNKRIQGKLASDTSWQSVVIGSLQGVPISFCMVVGLYWIVNTAKIPASLVQLFSYILFAVITVTLSRVTARAVTGIINLRLSKSSSRIPKTSLLGNIITGIIYAMGIIIFLQYCGISVTPIITAMGVGGMALALGMQDILANIFAGLHLSMSNQVRVGDYIRLSSGEEGQVTDITWRFTTIRTILGNLVVIPNKQMSAVILTNYNLPFKEFTVKVNIGVEYDSDLEKVERVTLEVAAEIMAKFKVKQSKKPNVLFHTFGDSAIEYSALLHAPSFEEQARLKHAFIMALTERFRKENISIAFPVRTLINK